MSIEEKYMSVTHQHNDCPVCNSKALMDIPKPRNEWDKLMLTIRNGNADLRIMFGKKIEVKEG